MMCSSVLGFGPLTEVAVIAGPMCISNYDLGQLISRMKQSRRLVERVCHDYGRGGILTAQFYCLPYLLTYGCFHISNCNTDTECDRRADHGSVCRNR